MKLAAFGSLVWFTGTAPTRVELLRALLENAMTEPESEDAQAEREIASLSHDDDPEPGAFYGLTPPTDTDPTHAEHQ
jgi:hypothetical protein